MAEVQTRELVDRFEQFFRSYYREAIGSLAQAYPNEQRSLAVDWQDLYRFDPDLADDYLAQPDQLRRYAEEALRVFDLPVDVSLGRAHVRVFNLPEATEIRAIRARDVNRLVSVQGIVRKATDVRPKIEEAAFECQRCGTLTYIPQSGGFQEPHECQGCERQGPFSINYDQSTFVDAQKLRVQERPEGLRGGETPQSIDVHFEDDVTGRATPGDHVTATGALRIEQQQRGNQKSRVFDVYMDGHSIEVQDEEFESMDITDEDKRRIIELSNDEDLYGRMVDSVAPSIYGFDEEKLAMTLQLFSGITKHLPDESRIRGDLHILLIGDPGTGKCVSGDTRVTLAGGNEVEIGDLVEANLIDPVPVDDGVFQDIDVGVQSIGVDGEVTTRPATRVWKREAPERMIRIETTSGTELEVTPTHPLFCHSDGRIEPVVADELSTGDFLAVPRRLDPRSNDDLETDYRLSRSNNAVRLDLPDRWTPGLARLIGFIVAEGYVERREDHTGFVSITDNDPEVLDEVATSLDRLGLNHFERSPHDGKDAREIVCPSGEFVSFLHNLEPALLMGSAAQRVPTQITRASRGIRSAFLQGFIEGEGHVSAHERELTVSSMSEDLLRGVRSLLLSVGIRSQLRPRANGSFRLRISGRDFIEYTGSIGFVTDRNSGASAAFDAVTENPNSDVVPDIGDELRRIRNRLHLSQFDCGIPRSTYQHYERGDRNPSRERLRSVVEAFEDRIGWLRRTRERIDGGRWRDVERVRHELDTSQQTLAGRMGLSWTAISYSERERAVPGGGRTAGAMALAIARIDGALEVEDDVRALRRLVDGDVAWDRIDSIDVVAPDYEWVYDLEVQGTHNYLANNVISHNSQLLQYIRHIAPRSVYTSGKGSSSAGLTAAAIRDDFGDGQQWTLEAGALVLADKGVAAIDELDKMRCVTGDALVQTVESGLVPIAELAREESMDGRIERLDNGRTIRDVDVSVFTMTDDARVVSRPVSAIHEYVAPRDLVEVTLESGETLTTTADHPFFVLEEGERSERPASELAAGDWTYVPREVPSPATDGGALLQGSGVRTDADPGPAVGAVLGYLVGDGNVTYDQKEGVYGIRFTNKENRLLGHFEAACEEAFGRKPVRYTSDVRADGVTTTKLRGKAVADAVLEAGANLETYDGKRLPGAVARGSRETKAAFVRALADSEGTVDTRCVKIASSSRDLLVGVKQLLLEFGISSQLQTRTRTENRDLHNLVITAKPSLTAFNDHVGFELDRKQRSLDAVCDAVSGDRTIIDVIPDCGTVLERVREGLRLYQSECGLVDATYCNLETGEANVSLHRAETVLERFEARLDRLGRDIGDLEDPCSWEDLDEIRARYHVSQRELAEGMGCSQPYISEHWGDGPLRRDVRRRLKGILEAAAETDLQEVRRLVRGDVKWRRVSDVRRVRPGPNPDDRVPILRTRIAESLGIRDPDRAVEAAQDLLSEPVEAGSWEELRDELERHRIPLEAVASELDVAGSTVSRWFSGTVRIGNFEDVRACCFDLVGDRRASLRRLLDDIDDRSGPTRVYDLTVEGTHNFIANGLIVHNSEDRSAMHEALEQQSISISKAGINATLKSRCSLLGAANPKYGRFDQYEPIAEQIDLEPALISRFDLIFTVTDQPDAERDRELADHILRTNYAGELNTQRTSQRASSTTQEAVDEAAATVEPSIDPDLFRKYIAYAKRNVFPAMSNDAREAIRDFYVDLRAQGTEEDAPVPITARKLEALVRLAEASARVRLSDTVERADAERVIAIVRSSLRAIGVDPETGRFDADVIETGTSKTQRDRIKSLRSLIEEIETEFDDGAPVEEVVERAVELGMEASRVEHEIETLKQRGELYEPRTNHLRTT